MRNHIAALLLGVLLGCLGPALAVDDDIPLYNIEDIDAYLFYEDKGIFSVDLVDTPNLTLWNVPIGEGSAEGPANSMLVVITVSGPPDAETRPNIVLDIREGEQTRLHKVQPVGLMSQEGRYYMPAFIENIGCQFISIGAAVEGEPASATSTLIPFRCGE